jgi:hypothetical protein
VERSAMKRLKLIRCWLRRKSPFFHYAYETGHLLYFGLVAFHSAYEIAAGGLAVLGVVYLLLKLE